MNDKNEKKPISKKVLWTRILCGFLALIMIGSMAYLAIQLIVDEINQKKNNKVESERPAIVELVAADAESNLI